MKNRVAPDLESAVLEMAIEQPAYGQVRVGLNCPGAKAVDYLLHLCFDLVGQTVAAVKITDGRTAEGFKNFNFAPGDIILADRVYAKAAQIIEVVQQGADVIVRVSLQQIKLYGANGKLLDWKQLLFQATAPEKFS